MGGLKKNEIDTITSLATHSRELLIMSSAGVSSVDNFTNTIRALLAKAQEVKPHGGVEPALTSQEFGGGVEELSRHDGASNKDFAAIETACRNIFYALLVRLSMNRDSNHQLIVRGIDINRQTFFWGGVESSRYYIYPL